MDHINNQLILEEYIDFLTKRDFPCVAARAAAEREQVKGFIATHMACPRHDEEILKFLYDFIDRYREMPTPFQSAAVIFNNPVASEEEFERLFWQRLQALADLDANVYKYDNRVNADPRSVEFSFSLKEEAFFIIGLHPMSSRPSRRFKYPALVFNPHAAFSSLRQANTYDKMKNIVRKRDMAYSGSINPMLDDFGNSSEVYQYTGKKYNNSWECPLKIKHAAT